MQLYQQIQSLQNGQAHKLELLTRQAVSKIGELSKSNGVSYFNLLSRLNHTLNKEVWMVNNIPSVTKSTPKYKIKQNEETFKNAVKQTGSCQYAGLIS